VYSLTNNLEKSSIYDSSYKLMKNYAAIQILVQTLVLIAFPKKRRKSVEQRKTLGNP